MRDFLDAIRRHVVIYDGGMGATLEQFELTAEDYGGLAGKCHEALVLNRPDVIEGVHASMLEAGAEVVETDTFQASRLKLDEWGLAEHTLEINTKAAEIARRAAGEHRFVAGSIGPTGYLPASEDPSLGQIRFGELVEIFTEQAEGLIAGGADLLIIETAQDILEVKAAVFGAREAFKRTSRTLPIHTSVSLLPNGGKMLLGTDISAVLCTLEALNVQVIGLNCSTGPQDMRDAIRFLGEHCPVPVACIPNAGLPLQGPRGETIFPEQPEPLAEALQEFVERYGVGIVGGCCGTTPAHIAAIAARVRERAVDERPAPRPPHLSSMIAATPLAQDPRPTLVGERVNSQGSRKAKELLLADDYDGLVQIAEDQVLGGAHVLDLCVALTERIDEDEQMRILSKRISLTQPAPIQVDSTEPEVLERALEQIPGRAVVNSINLEAGRAKLDRVVPLALEHGAALIALTIDETGMAKTAERKLEIARRLHELCCEEHGLDPGLLIFDCLTFTLVTGEEEWRPSAKETIEGIRLVKQQIPEVKTSLGRLERLLRGLPGGQGGAQLGVPAPLRGGGARPGDGQPEPHHPLRGDLARGACAGRRPRVRHPRRRAGALHRPLRVPRRGPAGIRRRRPDRRDGAGGGAALPHPAPAQGRRRGVDRPQRREDRRGPNAERRAAARDERGGRQIRVRRADPAVRAAVGRSDEARRGPARAVPRQAGGAHEGHGRARDRVRRRARHRQVAGQHDPHQQRLHGRGPRQAGPDPDDPRRRRGAQRDRDRTLGAARLDLQADAGVHRGAPEPGPVLPGPDRRGRDQPRLRLPRPVSRRARLAGGLRTGRLLLQGRLRGARRDGPADRRAGPRSADGEAAHGGPRVPRTARRGRHRPALDRRLRALCRPHRRARPHAAVLGRAGDPRRPQRRLPPPRHARAVQAPLGRQGQEGRGVADAAARGLPPAPGADVARAELPAPAGAARFLPLLRPRQRHRGARPRGPHDRAHAAGVSPPERRASGSAWPTSSALPSTAGRPRSSTWWPCRR